MLIIGDLVIPHNITIESILKAIEYININEVPVEHNSTKFVLRCNGDDYPAKYIISIANKYVMVRSYLL